MARLCANTLQGCLLEEIAARGLSLLLAGRDKRGEASARGGRTWAPRCGQGSGKGVWHCLISGRCLLDDGETGDAVERIGLHFESGIGDLATAAGTDSVRTCMERCECPLDPAELFDGEQIYGQCDIDLMFGGGLVDRVRKEFWLCRDERGNHGFVREHCTKSIEFLLKIRVIRVLPHMDARAIRRNISRRMIR